VRSDAPEGKTILNLRREWCLLGC